MTVATYSTVWAHTNTAQFQAWGSALSAAMQTCGLAQTADTGQINWSTVAIPTATNTSAGYEIYKFTDSLQATHPVFIKIEYGLGTQTATPSMWVTVGSATDGAGNLTGTTTTRAQVLGMAWSIVRNTAVAYPTYVCFNGSYLGVALKVGGLVSGNNGSLSATGAFMIGRSTDTSGQYVGGEVAILYSAVNNTNPNNGIIQCLNSTLGTVTTTTNYFTCAWFTPTATAVGGGSFQLYPCWGAFNEVKPLNWLLYGLTAELSQGEVISATPFGTTSHNYLMTGVVTTGWGLPNTANYAVLMLWE